MFKGLKEIRNRSNEDSNNQNIFIKVFEPVKSVSLRFVNRNKVTTSGILKRKLVGRWVQLVNFDLNSRCYPSIFQQINHHRFCH